MGSLLAPMTTCICNFWPPSSVLLSATSRPPVHPPAQHCTLLPQQPGKAPKALKQGLLSPQLPMLCLPAEVSTALHFPSLPLMALIAASRGGVVELGEWQGSRKTHTQCSRNVIKQWERCTCFFPFKVCRVLRCGKVNYPSLRDAPEGVCASYLN